MNGTQNKLLTVGLLVVIIAAIGGMVRVKPFFVNTINESEYAIVAEICDRVRTKSEEAIALSMDANGAPISGVQDQYITSKAVAKGVLVWRCGGGVVRKCNTFSIMLDRVIFLNRKMMHPPAGNRMHVLDREGVLLVLVKSEV